MKIGADISGLGLLAQLGEEVPRTLAAQFESVLAQQLVHALVQGAGLGQSRGDEAPGAYLSMMEGALAQELARSGQLAAARALAVGEGP